MDEREFWARAFLSSQSWIADSVASNKSRAEYSADSADAALVEYCKRFGAAPVEKEAAIPSARNAMVRLEMEREKLASLERTLGQDSPAIAESRAMIARLEAMAKGAL